MPKSKKRIKKNRREQGSSKISEEGIDDASVGLISSLRGGFQDLAGARPKRGSPKRGIGIAGVLLVILIAAVLIAFFAKGKF